MRLCFEHVKSVDAIRVVATEVRWMQEESSKSRLWLAGFGITRISLINNPGVCAAGLLELCKRVNPKHRSQIQALNWQAAILTAIGPILIPELTTQVLGRTRPDKPSQAKSRRVQLSKSQRNTQACMGWIPNRVSTLSIAASEDFCWCLCVVMLPSTLHCLGV